MHRILCSISVIALALLLAPSMAVSTVHAAPGDRAVSGKSGAPDKVATGARAGAGKQKVKVLTFGDGSDIEGGVVSPDGDNVTVRTNVVYSSLIRVRSDFVPEIFKSAEDL